MCRCSTKSASDLRTHSESPHASQFVAHHPACADSESIQYLIRAFVHPVVACSPVLESPLSLADALAYWLLMLPVELPGVCGVLNACLDRIVPVCDHMDRRYRRARKEQGCRQNQCADHCSPMFGTSSLSELLVCDLICLAFVHRCRKLIPCASMLLA